MSVAGVPAFLEERQVFVRERMNGLYGPGPYALANTLVSLPYLFACVAVFSVLTYWSIGLHPGAARFFKFTSIVFVSIFAAESQVGYLGPLVISRYLTMTTQCAMVSALIPIFVAALAVTSFINGFWMVRSRLIRWPRLRLTQTFRSVLQASCSEPSICPVFGTSGLIGSISSPMDSIS